MACTHFLFVIATQVNPRGIILYNKWPHIKRYLLATLVLAGIYHVWIMYYLKDGWVYYLIFGGVYYFYTSTSTTKVVSWDLGILSFYQGLITSRYDQFCFYIYTLDVYCIHMVKLSVLYFSNRIRNSMQK